MINDRKFESLNKDSELPKIELGKTGLFVTPLCIGAAPLGDMPADFGFSVSSDNASEILRRTFEGQINFIDTSANYGSSEKRIGEHLKRIGGLPSSFVLATKADRNMETGDFSGEQIKLSIEKSLKLLGADSLQIVYLHDPENSTFEQIMSPKGPLEVLQNYKDQGVIKHIGVAGGPVDLMMRYAETDHFEVVITHNRWNLLFRNAGPLLKLASDKGIGVLNAAPFGSGMLAQGPGSYPRFAYRPAGAELIGRVENMEMVCRKHGISLKQAALQFSLINPLITSTIVGISEKSQIDELVSLYHTQIPQEIWPELEKFAIYDRDPEKD